jgi:hypothetical protein
MLKEVENPDAVKAVGIPGITSGGADALKSDAAQQPHWTPLSICPTEIVHITAGVAPGNA